MIEITQTEIYGLEPAIRGMRNPMESHHLSDSNLGFSMDCGEYNPTPFKPSDGIGPNDKKLMLSLAKAGPEHAKYRRMIVVYCDILAPLYWWKEFDTYKIGTVANSYSTMHKIHTRPFTIDMVSHEHLSNLSMKIMYDLLHVMNIYRDLYLETDDPELKKDYWWQMIQLLPTSWNQKRTVMSNYQVLSEQYRQRNHHKQDEWRIDYINWIESLPFNWIITGKDDIDYDLRSLNEDDLEPTPSH